MKKATIVIILISLLVAFSTLNFEAGNIVKSDFGHSNEKPKCLGYLWYKYNKNTDDFVMLGDSIGKIYCIGILLKK